MKKLFLFLALITAATSVWADGFKTVTKTVAQLKTAHSDWENGKDYTNIALDDAITVSRGKYYYDNSKNTHMLRSYYQDKKYGAGFFSVSAKEGVIIHSVKFTYTTDKSNTVLSDYYCYGSDLPSGKTSYTSGNAFVIDVDTLTFYVSRTTSTGGSNLNITAFEVSYTYPTSPELKFVEASKTVCKNAAAFINPLQNKGNGAVTYESSNESVAKVASDGTVTVKGVVGDATITATAAGTSFYKGESKSYNLTVSSNLTPSPLALVEITESKDAASMATQYGWANDQSYTSFKLNNAITFTAPSGQAKYLSSSPSMRYYRYGEGKVNIKAKTGAIIKSVTFDYGRVDSGLVTWNWGTNGQNIPSAYVLWTGKSRMVNADTVSFSIGQNNVPNNNGQVRITNYKVVYTDPTIVFEQFKAYTGGTSTQSIVGDSGVYKWRITADNHSENLGIYKAIKLNYADTIASNGDLEGGIKSISFDWRTTGGNYPNHFFVKAGSVTDEISIASFNNTSRILTYSHDFNIESNTTLAIYNPTQETPQQNHVAVGPVHITPYLLFNVPNHAATLNAEDGTKCDLNSALINNTDGGTILFDVIENTAGGNPSITDGILDFSSVVRTGTIKVQASWSGVTTTLTLTINLKNPEISFAKTTDTKMKTEGSYTQPLTSNLSSGAVSYSLVNAPAGASINPSTGEVTFSTAGDYEVQGKVVAALPYAEDSTTYRLTVTELIVPTLKFDTSYVEKPVGADGFINTFSKPDDDTGAVTYKSDSTHVATVEENGDGTVTIVGAGTTTITASVAETSKYAAGNKSYTLKVFPLPVMSMGNDTSVYLNAPNFIRTASVTAGDGEITYSSSDDLKATVNASTGEVHIVGSGSVVITATMAKSANYWSGSASYNLSVSNLKLPTASFAESIVDKNQNDAPFTKEASTESDGVKHYSSSDTRVATVDELTGEVTMGEKPGTTIISVSLDASDTWAALNNAAQYTLNVSAAKVADLHILTITTDSLKKKHGFENDKNYTNIALNDVLTLSKGKYYTESGGILRYYQKYDNPTSFTIQAKAGVIIQTVKFTYISQNEGTLAKKSGTSIIEADRYVSGTTYPVDANSFTCYYGNKGTGDNGRADITEFEIKYFDPAIGVAVTKTAADLGKDFALVSDQCYQNIAINQAITMHADDASTMRYKGSGFDCYRHKGAIDIIARPGATIHYVKISYSSANGTDNFVLTKYFGSNGFNIPAIDQIASDSILYVNAKSLKLYIGTPQSSAGWSGVRISKIYVNYSDSSVVTVDNFNKCTPKSGDSVVVAGVDNKYEWTFKKFARDNAQRMYYDQSVLINKGGKLYTEYTGGLQEVAFDWHPTVSGKPVSFKVIAGDSSWTVSKTAAVMDKIYTFNFQKTANKTNGEFAIIADSAIEIGHVSLTPYIIYTCKDTTIAAKDYKDAGWKFNSPSLINYTGQAVSYNVSGENADQIASINDEGVVTILGDGTVMVNATADGATASYQLTILLENAGVEFAEKTPSVSVGAGHYEQTADKSTTASLIYEFVGEHKHAQINSTTGYVTFDSLGVFTIKASALQELPYKAGEDQYVLTVSESPKPGISYADTLLVKDINDSTFTNPLSSKAGVGDTTYISTDTLVAKVNEKGKVTIKSAGTTRIKAIVASSTLYSADTAAYTLRVLPLPEMSFAEASKSVYLNATPFINNLTISDGAGAVSYSSSDTLVATVNVSSGLVTVKASGSTTITAKSLKSETYSAGSLDYNLSVSDLKLPTASFAEGTVNKVQDFAPFTNELTTVSDGVKTYESSDPRVATVNATTGEVTKGEKPGTTIIKVKIAASATWEKIEQSYTLNVSAAQVVGWNSVTKTVAQMRGTAEWTSGSQHPNIAIVDGIILSDGKYYSNSDGEHFRYYYNADPKYVSSTTFTIQANAGVIIQTVKINYIKGNDKMVLADDNYNGAEVASANRIISGTTYKVDANSVTYYVGRTGALPSSNNFVNVTGYEIKYFDPSTGVAVTKTVGDLGKQYNLVEENCHQDITINHAISLHADNTNTLRYYTGQFNCYRTGGPLYIRAREGATIHYVKVSYSAPANATLTKYFGTNGGNIPAIDRIASDSVIYVNANSLRLYVGDTANAYPTLAITKIYVNYTDSSIVTVDNFDNCESPGTGGSVEVAGVDGKYNWSIYNFSRSDANRMYYDQSIKLNKNGKILTEYTGGLKEVAFDWHPTTDAAVNFTVKAGDSICTIDKAAQGGVYTFNFQQLNNKTNGEFSIKVNSDAAVEVGHISLTPYIIYACKDTIIAAKDYKDAGYKFTNPSLINNTGETVAYSITGDASVAEIDPASGEVTIKSGGTVKVNATADGATASYQLTINLESTSATFAEHAVERLVSDGSYKQELQVETEATEGNEVTYSFIGNHEGASINTSTGEVTFIQAGQFKILGQLAQNMPYAAAQDSFTLTVTGKAVPHISYEVPAVSRRIEEGAYTNPLTSFPGVGDTTYVSSDPVVASVDDKGEVTPLKAGTTTIKAYVAESENYAADSAQYTFTVLGDPLPGGKTVVGNIAAIAERDSWSDGQHRPYFKLDNVISVSDSNKNNLNAHYLKSEECVRFYQNQTKGQFFVRAKAGAIIQSIQFTYTSQNDGVITNNYGSDGKSIAAANQYVSGVTYKMDANKLTFYTGSTADKNNGEVHITSIVVRYFDPENGEAVTKNVSDLAKQNGLVSGHPYQNVAVNNVIKLHADQGGTLKYYSPNQFNCYNGCGPIDIIAREGATIHYVKVTYANGDGVLTQNVDGGLNLSAAQYVASDSILSVNGNSVRLYIGSKGATYQTLAISKIYVNYTDSNAIVDNFDNCTKIYGGDTPTKVVGVDSTFTWEFTQFNRDSLRRIGYDQSTMLRQAGGKIAANNVDGGVKEVSFDWFGSNSNQGVKFYVKAGGQTFTIDSAAAGGYYPITYTLSDIKTNGAFSIEMDPASGSQMEIGHISLMPYLYYSKKVDTVLVGTVYKPNLVDFRGSDEGITFTSSKDSVAYVAADGTVTADHVGTATITASWDGASTSYQIIVEGDKTVIALKRNDGTDNADTLINNYGETMPEMTLPTRENYRFNAYFPDASASNPQERITVTAWDAKTYYVANVKHSNKTVTMTDAGRHWVYDRPTYDLYAQWMPEVTIVLDNQDATVAGTEQVKTAHCPNNASVNLSQNITVPTKAGGIFRGYTTQPKGQGDTLINENGAFIASVAGYTNETKMWLKDEGATLYANWIHYISYEPGARHLRDSGEMPIDTLEHHVGDIITLPKADSLYNPGHTWTGWRVSYFDVRDSIEYNVDTLNGKFTMPDYDVTVYGTWVLTDTVVVTPRIVKDTLTSTMVGGNVISIVNGGNLIVDEAKAFDTIYVNDGGQISADQKLTVKDLVIRATASAKGTSGQIVDVTNDNIQINEAFFDLTLAKSGTDEQWHAFTVPFPVNMLTGIYDLDGNKLINEEHYAIMVYQGNVRAKGKYGWTKVHHTGNVILQPGTFYIMATDGERSTYRMKMDGSFSVASKSLPVYDYDSTETVAQDKGWNGIGNSQLQYCSVDATVQVLDPIAYVFRAIPSAQAKDFAVGTPFFYQADNNGTIVLNTDAVPAPMRAITNELKEVEIALANDEYADYLYLSSTEGATNNYQVGRDLTKMAMTNAPAVPQICGKAYDANLCVMDMPMVNDQVSYSVLLYAPKAGEYTISAAQVEGYEIFLTKDGSAIWNLSMSAATLDLAKGNTNGYGIVIKKAPQVTTDMENVWGNGDETQKFIYNDMLYIIHNGIRYNANGQMLK